MGITCIANHRLGLGATGDEGWLNNCAQCEVARARKTAEYWKAEHHAGNAEIERLCAENEALRRDAERYRKLAQQFGAMSLEAGGNHAWMWRGNPARLRGPTLDAALDHIPTPR